MKESRIIGGYLKLTRAEKVRLLLSDKPDAEELLVQLDKGLCPDPGMQNLQDIAPNFLVNGRYNFVPMVTEESSVVSAASSAAKFWAGHAVFIQG
jgi:hydroxymethylglutaryl-CoA reductase